MWSWVDRSFIREEEEAIVNADIVGVHRIYYPEDEQFNIFLAVAIASRMAGEKSSEEDVERISLQKNN